jgi:hypothetical protein
LAPYNTQSRFYRFKYNRFFEEFGTKLGPFAALRNDPAAQPNLRLVSGGTQRIVVQRFENGD